MKQWSMWVVAVAVAMAPALRAEEVKIKLEGIRCDACGDALADALKKVPGAKLKGAPSLGKDVIAVDLDLKKGDLGDVAKAAAGAETPHKAEEAPSANLVLAAPGLNDKNKKGIADALKKVDGVDAALSLGDLKKKEIVVRLDDKGGAKLEDIKKALASYLK